MRIDKERAIRKFAGDLVRDYVYEGSLKIDNLSQIHKRILSGLIMDHRNDLDYLYGKHEWAEDDCSLSYIIKLFKNEITQDEFIEVFFERVIQYYEDAMQEYLDDALEDWKQIKKEKDPDDY